ncbi:hypothetical protein [Propionibacterium freudenreichii]|uniref:hypothetical protein n=1 Tax=Propionibacterium freudenreichii TaxID=1744 RepID=UPI00254A2ABB|nr:hypothetical protein [Propionibacterium freudenreichii]MDK9661605.1 hypothetical protein [Propionibacterium freudenreichii]
MALIRTARVADTTSRLVNACIAHQKRASAAGEVRGEVGVGGQHLGHLVHVEALGGEHPHGGIAGGDLTQRQRHLVAVAAHEDRAQLVGIDQRQGRAIGGVHDHLRRRVLGVHAHHGAGAGRRRHEASIEAVQRQIGQQQVEHHAGPDHQFLVAGVVDQQGQRGHVNGVAVAREPFTEAIAESIAEPAHHPRGAVAQQFPAAAPLVGERVIDKLLAGQVFAYREADLVALGPGAHGVAAGMVDVIAEAEDGGAHAVALLVIELPAALEPCLEYEQQPMIGPVDALIDVAAQPFHVVLVAAGHAVAGPLGCAVGGDLCGNVVQRHTPPRGGSKVFELMEKTIRTAPRPQIGAPAMCAAGASFRIARPALVQQREMGAFRHEPATQTVIAATAGCPVGR